MLLRQESNGLGNHSYCRSPNNYNVPWCFTDDPNFPWQECDVSECFAATNSIPYTRELSAETTSSTQSTTNDPSPTRAFDETSATYQLLTTSD